MITQLPIGKFWPQWRRCGGRQKRLRYSGAASNLQIGKSNRIPQVVPAEASNFEGKKIAGRRLFAPDFVQKMKKSNIVARKGSPSRFPFLSDSHIPDDEHEVGKAGGDVGFTEHRCTTSLWDGKRSACKKLGDKLGLRARRPSPENRAGKVRGFVVYNVNHWRPRVLLGGDSLNGGKGDLIIATGQVGL